MPVAAIEEVSDGDQQSGHSKFRKRLQDKISSLTIHFGTGSTIQ